MHFKLVKNTLCLSIFMVSTTFGAQNIPIEKQTERAVRSLKTIDEQTIPEEFQKISTALNTVFMSFIDTNNGDSREKHLENLSLILTSLEEKVLTPLQERITNTADEHPSKKVLVEVHTMLQQWHKDLVAMHHILKSCPNSTSNQDLLLLYKKVEKLKYLLPKKARGYSILEWRAALVHRFSCK